MRPAGFTIDGPVAIPRRPFDDTTRQRVMRVTAAAVLGYTPEDITNFLAVGFPDRVEQEVSRPLAGDELAALAGVIVAAAETSTPELTTT